MRWILAADTRDKLEEVSKRSTDGKNILSSKTKNLRELLLHKYEAQKVGLSLAVLLHNNSRLCVRAGHHSHQRHSVH